MSRRVRVASVLRARGFVRGVLRNIPSEVTKRCSLHFISLCPAELSLYELHRKPHEMVTDSTVVAVSPRALRSELMCPICLDLMRTPLTTKEVVVFACFPTICVPSSLSLSTNWTYTTTCNLHVFGQHWMDCVHVLPCDCME